MYQDTPQFYYPQNEAISSISSLVGHSLYSTPNSQGTESEKSFDSGYLSPANSQYVPGSSQTAPGKYTPLTNDQYMLNGSIMNYQHSPKPTNKKVLFDDEWDKKFIENFEANLFGIDSIEDFSSEDINLFSEILSSPLKTGLSPVRLYDRNNSPSALSRSLHQNLFSPPKSINSRRNLLGHESSNWSNNNILTNVPNTKEHIKLTGLSDRNLNFNLEVKEDLGSSYSDQSLSTHNYAKPHSVVAILDGPGHKQRYPKTEFTEIQPAHVINTEPILENVSPELLPSKQKLQYVRAKFTHILQKTVESANTAAINGEKYPQLTRRLLKSNSVPQATKLKENIPSFSQISSTGRFKYRTSSFSSPSTYTGETEDRNLQSTTLSRQEFRELAPVPSQKRTFACIVNNNYEVQQQSDCQVEIKKHRTY